MNNQWLNKKLAYIKKLGIPVKPINWMSKCHCKKYTARKLNIESYLTMAELWKQQEQAGKIKLIIGTCPIENIKKHVEWEEPWILYHFIKCSCGRLYRVGHFCRGRPFVEGIFEIPKNAYKETEGEFQVNNLNEL